MDEQHVTSGLPADLASVLRNQSVIVPQDAAVFELIAAWGNAPNATASAAIGARRDAAIINAFNWQSQVASSTTPASCR